MNRYTIGVIEKHLYHVDVEATNADEAEQKAVDLLVNDDNPMENFPNSYEGFEFDSIVETTEPPKRRIRIVHDDSPESPREWDNLGTMVCWHNRYTLGNEQPSRDPLEHMLYLCCEHDSEGAARAERAIEAYPYPNNHEEWRAFDQYHRDIVTTLFDKHFVWLPLYLYDHGGITMSTGRFSCPWDSGQVGFIYVSKEKVRKEYGWKYVTTKRAEQVARYLTGEVETYAQYLEGRVYGFITEIFNPTTDKWEEGDSCWGFYGQDYEGIAESSGFSVEEVKDAFNNVEY
jgi:hypothetical protein